MISAKTFLRIWDYSSTKSSFQLYPFSPPRIPIMEMLSAIAKIAIFLIRSLNVKIFFIHTMRNIRAMFSIACWCEKLQRTSITAPASSNPMRFFTANTQSIPPISDSLPISNDARNVSSATIFSINPTASKIRNTKKKNMKP